MDRRGEPGRRHQGVGGLAGLVVVSCDGSAPWEHRVVDGALANPERLACHRRDERELPPDRARREPTERRPDHASIVGPPERRLDLLGTEL